jgi:hypothetical protein
MADLSYLRHQIALLDRAAGRKERFFALGTLNALITNSLLQVLLLFQPIWIATLFSQIFNSCFGFLLYGKAVFRVARLTMISFYLYAFTAFILWMANASGIKLLIYLGLQKNFAAALVIPFLAIISYSAQKFIVFPDDPSVKSGVPKLFDQSNEKS